MREFLKSNDSKVVAKTDTTCSEFLADTALARKSGILDVTGLGGCFCSHHFLLAFHDLFTGERWAYSTFTLDWLMKNGVLPLFWWYDINCRYRHHVQEWAKAALAKDKLSWAAAFWIGSVMRYPVPPFHISAHNANCQALNGCSGMEDAGRGAGEPTETAWSFLRQWGHLTSLMSHAKRDLTLERMAMAYNASKESSLLRLLVRRFYLAVARNQQSMLEMDAVVAAIQRMRPEWSGAEVMEHLRGVAAPAAAPSVADLSAEAQYVEASARAALIVSATSAVLPAHLVGINKSYVEGGHVHKRCLATIQALKDPKPEVAAALDAMGPIFRVALLELCVYRMGERQAQAHQRFQELILARMTKKVMDVRRGDCKRLQDAIDRDVKRLKGVADLLVDWAQRTVDVAAEAQAAAPDGAFKYARGVEEAKSIIALASDADFRAKALHTALKEGRFPWADVDAGTGGSLERLELAGRKCLNDFMRSKEQCELCVAEVAGAAAFWEQRCVVLRRALAEWQQVGEAGSADAAAAAVGGSDNAKEAEWEAGKAAREAARAAQRAAASIKWLNKQLKKYEELKSCAAHLHSLLEARWAQMQGGTLTQEEHEGGMVEALQAALEAPGADDEEEVADEMGGGDDLEDDLGEVDEEEM